jgi:hypothetical protein
MLIIIKSFTCSGARSKKELVWRRDPMASVSEPEKIFGVTDVHM